MYLTLELSKFSLVSQDAGDDLATQPRRKALLMTRVSVSILAPLLGMIAACTSIETTESSASVSDIDSTAPGAPALSADDTPAADSPVVCNDCDGEAPALPSHICDDGTVAGPTCVATSGACEWVITECPDPQPTDCSASDCPTGQHCEIDCHPCDAPDPKTPCDSFTCQSTCVPD